MERPRHFERRGEVEAAASARGLRAVRKSDLDSGAAASTQLSPDDILLGDTTGEMMGLYPFATVAVVGRTFRSRGGQNMIEPCLCGVPTVVGPETQNFRPVMADLMAAGAIAQVQGDDGLEPAIDALLSDASRRAELGGRASKAVASRRGVVNACAAAFRDYALSRA